jgi:hypothetical protein
MILKTGCGFESTHATKVDAATGLDATAPEYAADFESQCITRRVMATFVTRV